MRLTTKPKPPAPTSEWPVEVGVRRLFVVVGIISLLVSPISSKVLVIAVAIAGSIGYRLAMSVAERRRSNAEYTAMRRREMKPTHTPQESAERWAWRLGFVLLYLFFAVTRGQHLTFLFVFAGYLGWSAAEFVDRRSAAGEKEWRDWETDMQSWHEDERRHEYEAEWRWAAAFHTYMDYSDARETPPGRRILSEEEYNAARAGQEPNDGARLW